MNVGVGLTIAALVVSAAALLMSATGARKHDTRARLEDHETRLKACEDARRILVTENGTLRDDIFRLYRENDELRRR